MLQFIINYINIGTPPSPVQSSYPDSISSFSSTSIQFGSTVGSFLSNGEYDHLPLQQELDQTHIQLVSGYTSYMLLQYTHP